MIFNYILGGIFFLILIIYWGFSQYKSGKNQGYMEGSDDKENEIEKWISKQSPQKIQKYHSYLQHKWADS